MIEKDAQEGKEVSQEDRDRFLAHLHDDIQVVDGLIRLLHVNQHVNLQQVVNAVDRMEVQMRELTRLIELFNLNSSWWLPVKPDSEEGFKDQEGGVEDYT